MNLCLDNGFLLNVVLGFLDPKSIMNFSLVNIKIKKILDPSTNEYINTVYLVKLINDFFEYDNLSKKYNLLGKNLQFKTNWRSELIELNINFSVCKEEKIRKKLRDFFRIHIYLPDLRKECFVLEFPNSTIHVLKCYDIHVNLIHIYNYYSKYFTPELILNQDIGNGKIIILRERLIFEEYLINFKQLFYDYINNDKYITFINNVRDYKYDSLIDLYNKNDKNINLFKTNEENSIIINFILWIVNLFFLYTRINYEYIEGLLFNDIEEPKLINEYISKKSDLINCALLINSSFENINIIVNLLGVYTIIYKDYKKKYLESQNSSEEIKKEFHLDEKDSVEYKSIIIYSTKFTLYNLFLKIIDEKFTKKLPQINNKYPIIVKNYFKSVLLPKEEKKEDKNEIVMEIEEEDKNEYQDCNDNNKDKKKKPKKEKKIILYEDYKLTPKYLLENFLNCELDNYIDGKNAFGIMHTLFKINEEYINNYENVLIKIFEEMIKECINQKIPINKIFDIVQKITECEGNSRSIYTNKDSLIIIRRTKMRLMQKGYKTIFNQLEKDILKDFKEHIRIDSEDNQKYIFLSSVEKLNMKEYTLNLDVLSREGYVNVKNNVNNEIERAKDYITKNCNLNESETYLASDYINCSKIEYVYFFKELVWNYYKQMEIYNERNYKVEYYLKNNKNRFIEQKDKENTIKITKGKYTEKLPVEELLFPIS